MKRYEQLIRQAEVALARNDTELVKHQLNRLRKFFKAMEMPLKDVNFMYENML